MDDEPLLWRKCVGWLKSLTIISDDDPVLQDDAQFDVFAKQLRDGVLLCRLAGHLSKHSPAVLEQIVWSPNNSEVNI